MVSWSVARRKACRIRNLPPSIAAEFLVQKFSCLERVEDTGTSLEARRRAYNMAGAAGVRTRPSSSYWGRRRRHDRSF